MKALYGFVVVKDFPLGYLKSLVFECCTLAQLNQSRSVGLTHQLLQLNRFSVVLRDTAGLDEVSDVNYYVISQFREFANTLDEVQVG